MLSLIPNTKLRVIDDEGSRTHLVAAGDLVGKHVKVYDFYGKKHDIRLAFGKTERRWLCECMSGEMIQFGNEHTINMRRHDVAGYVRTPLIGNAGGLVRLPQKKVYPPRGAAASLDMDEKTGALFMSFENIKDLVEVMEAVSSCGVTVERHKTMLRVDIEDKRPVCWASKLLNGNFQSDFEFAMNDLAARGIIHPHKMYSPEVLDETKRTGIIFEGNCVYNDFPFIVHRPVDKEAEVVVVLFDDPSLFIETQWFCT